MKVTEIDSLLREQLGIRLKKMSDPKRSEDERKQARLEAETLEHMLMELRADRLDRTQRYVEMALKSGVTVMLAVLGYGFEGLFGNTFSNTLKNVISKSPRM